MEHFPFSQFTYFSVPDLYKAAILTYKHLPECGFMATIRFLIVYLRWRYLPTNVTGWFLWKQVLREMRSGICWGSICVRKWRAERRKSSFREGLREPPLKERFWGTRCPPEHLTGSFYLHPTQPVDTGAWELTGLERTDFLQLGQTEGIESWRLSFHHTLCLDSKSFREEQSCLSPWLWHHVTGCHGFSSWTSHWAT